MWIGCLKHCKDKVENVNWVTDCVKCLGIYFDDKSSHCLWQGELNGNKLLIIKPNPEIDSGLTEFLP